MANDARSRQAIKDDDSNNSKGRRIRTRGSTSLGVATPKSSGLRRSTRDISSKKHTSPSPSSTRKSGRLEKFTSTTPVIRKSEKAEKENIQSPLRRSERAKRLSSSSSSVSKKSNRTSGSSDFKQKKEKKEKSVKRLTVETKEVKKIEKQIEKSVNVEEKRMNARAYKALFERPTKEINAPDSPEELDRMDKLFEDCSSICKGNDSKKIDGGFDRSNGRRDDLKVKCLGIACESTLEGSNSDAIESMKEILKSTVEVEPSGTVCAVVNDGCEKEAIGSGLGEGISKTTDMVSKISDDTEMAAVGCSAENNMDTSKLLNRESGLERDDKTILAKRKINTIDMVSDPSDMVMIKDACRSIGDASTSPSGCRSKSCSQTSGTCLKRQRVNCNAESSWEFCDMSFTKDREELAGHVITGPQEISSNHMQQNGCSGDFQTEADQNTCYICKLDGKLLCCEGRRCKRSYHLPCLDPPIKHVPLGVWYCSSCVRKKIEFGVHSVSEGVELICDTREVEVPNCDGLQKQKEYFVKYKGLAHIHNRWLPESQLDEAPSLLAKFNRKNEAARWKQEWTVPQRLLQKRLLMTHPKQHDEQHKGHHDDDLNCCHEWLVKWRGLNYEHATWELENSSFLKSREGQRLIEAYESRCKKEKAALRVDKTDGRKKDSSVKLLQLSAGGSSELNNHLDFVNKLRDHWYQGRNAVVFDDQERIVKMISFIFSLSSDVFRPLLIISTPAALHSWDDKLFNLAPSVDVVVYNGSKEIRESIRKLEFSEEGDSVMFQVLITLPEVLSEDISVFQGVEWEMIIVDDWQSPKISSHFKQIKILNSSLRILLVSGRLKDTSSEYLNLLTLLETHCILNDDNHLAVNSRDDIASLKERLAKYIINGCKSESFRFVEYWVPVQISNIQLEQYCATLISNSLSLCSPSKNDPVGALCNTLVTIRKCCDHPYAADESLQSSINKDLEVVEYLDVGIKASGKLQLLDAMLMEIKSRGLKVLILFQPIGGFGRDLVGDILDDFLRQRFGPDSYERIARDIVSSKKQSAMNRFNKEIGRFVFLLETRACHPSIKLSSVDTVIIFDSNWTLVNDLRALQKITFDSECGQIKIFRLYSACTVEERILILAKESRSLDSDPQNIGHGTTHMLLMWGASYLFDKLEEFHCHNGPASITSNLFEQPLLEDVIQEFLTILTQNSEDNGASEFSLVVKANQSQGTYVTDFPLFGEPKVELCYEKLPHIFWLRLLKGRNPHWKYCSGSSQRNRKRVQVQHFDDSLRKPEIESDAVKKHKKMVSNSADPLSTGPGLQEGAMVNEVDKERTLESAAHAVSQQVSSINDTRRGNCVSNLSCSANDISKRPGSMLVESRERRHLRKSQKSLHLLLKPEIARLCEVLHLSDDVREMVKKFLDYVMSNHRVNREPATILQAFQISLCWTSASLLKHKIDHKESLALAKEHLKFGCKKEEAEYVYSMLQCLKSLFLCHAKNLELACSLKNPAQSEAVGEDNLVTCLSRTFDSRKMKVQIGDSLQGQEYSSKQTLLEPGFALGFQLAQKDLSKSIKDIQKKFRKKMMKLFQKQEEEKLDYDRKYKEQKAQLENKKRMEAAVIRLCSNVQTKTDKLKKLDSEYAKRFDKLKHQMDLDLNSLEAAHTAARIKLQEKEASWVEGVRSWAQVELVKPPLNKHGPVEVAHCDEVVNITSDGGVRTVDVMSVKGLKAYDRAGAGANDPKNVLSLASSSKEQAAVGDMSDGEIQSNSPRPVTANRRPPDVPPATCSCQHQTDNGAQSSVRDGEIQLYASMEAPSSVQEIPNSTTIGNGVETLNYIEAPEGIMSMDIQSSDNQTPYQATQCVPDGEVSLRSPETDASNVGLEHDDSLVPPSTGELVSDREITVEVQETAPTEIIAGDNSSEGTNRACIVASNNAAGMDQLDGAGCAVYQETNYLESSLVDSPSLQPVSTSDQGGCTPSNKGLNHVHSLPSTSGNQVEHLPVPDQLSSEMQNIPQQDEPSLPHQLSSEGLIASPITQDSRQVVENYNELPSEAALQPPVGAAGHLPTDTIDGFSTYTSAARTSSIPSAPYYRPLQTGYQVPYQMPLPLHNDPLQNEMERLKKESDEVLKIHEETKVQLKSDWEKEIFQINAKYEAKLQEKEAEFLRKKEELDINCWKVYMNKILAEAFRSKCKDVKASAAPGMQSGVMQQLIPQSSQQRLSIATGLPPTAPVAASLQTAPSAVSSQVMAPLLQAVNFAARPATLACNPLARPPLVGTMSPAAGNHQLSSEIRAPAPHLQPFRPSTSVPVTDLQSLTRGISSQLANYNPPASNLSLQHCPPNILPPARIPRLETAGGFSALPNTPRSAMEMLMDVSNQAPVDPNRPSNFSRQPINPDPLVQSQPGNSSIMRPNIIQTGRPVDIVCLSDSDED